MEAHHHVGHLHAGVVDVILHLDLRSGSAQHPNERIAQCGVPQMADVRRLVRIDVGVLDNDFAARRGHTFGFAPQQCRGVRAAVEADIDVAVARHFDRRHSGNRPDFGGQFNSNLLRRLAQLLGELKRRRHGEFTEIALPRLVDGNAQVYAIANLYVCVKRVCNLLFDGMEHGNLRVYQPPEND